MHMCFIMFVLFSALSHKINTLELSIIIIITYMSQNHLRCVFDFVVLMQFVDMFCQFGLIQATEKHGNHYYLIAEKINYLIGKQS